MRTLAIDGRVALRRRGLEVGGLLFGEARGDDLHILAVEELPCEHRFGPSFTLSDTDRLKLNDLVSHRHGELGAVGFFRSFTGREPVIEEADEAFVRENFPRGDFMYLLLQPLSVETCLASFRFFRDGELLPSSDDPPFVFDPKRIPLMEAPDNPQARPPEEPARTATVKTLPAPREEVTHRARLDLDEESTRPARRWIPVLCGLLVVVGAGAVYEFRNPPRQPQPAGLHLDARPVNGNWELTWDTSVARARQATMGKLAVTEGDAHRDIMFDAVDIEKGKFTYRGSHGNVALRMTLYANGKMVADDALKVSDSADAVGSQPAASLPSAPAAAPSAAPAETRAAAPETPQRAAVPPSPLHEVRPAVPEGIRARLDQPVVIRVEVRVNEKGSVVRAAAPRQPGTGVRRYLADLAQKSAYQWQFSPARTRQGTPVAGSKTIQFVFTP